MSEDDGHTDAVTAPRDPREGGHRPPAGFLVLLAILGIAAAGWGVVTTVDALESDPDCGSYGYGGYGGYGCPPDHTDGTIDVQPSTDLVDRQSVTLTGGNFDPNTLFGAAQCDAALAPELQSVDACDLRTSVIGYTDAEGNIELTMRVRRVIVVQGQEIDCAQPGACIVGGATLAGPYTPVEASFVEIAFDPAVPAVPPLTVEITVEAVSAQQISGLATCNRDAQLSVNAQVSQTKGGHTAFAYGYSASSTACGTAPVRWVAPLFSSSGRLSGGAADYEAYAYAFDGFDTAFDEAEGTTRLRGSPLARVEPARIDGATITVDVVGSRREGTTLVVDVLVTCDRPSDFGYVSVQLAQWVGREQVFGYGNLPLESCDGATQVAVPITPDNGVFAGGPALARAFAAVETFTPPSTWFYDSASVIEPLRLHGVTRSRVTLAPNPTSRITIEAATPTAVTGSVLCAEPASVYLYAEVEQLAGRRLRTAYGGPEIACDGSTPFTVGINGDLAGGTATALVYGSAYRRIPGDPFPTYEYLWNDYQAAGVNVRR